MVLVPSSGFRPDEDFKYSPTKGINRTSTVSKRRNTKLRRLLKSPANYSVLWHPQFLSLTTVKISNGWRRLPSRLLMEIIHQKSSASYFIRPGGRITFPKGRNWDVLVYTQQRKDIVTRIGYRCSFEQLPCCTLYLKA